MEGKNTLTHWQKKLTIQCKLVLQCEGFVEIFLGLTPICETFFLDGTEVSCYLDNGGGGDLVDQAANNLSYQMFSTEDIRGFRRSYHLVLSGHVELLQGGPLYQVIWGWSVDRVTRLIKYKWPHTFLGRVRTHHGVIYQKPTNMFYALAVPNTDL